MAEQAKTKGNGKGIDAALWRKVRIRALETDRSTAEVMNEALRKYFEEKPANQESGTASPQAPPTGAPRTAPPEAQSSTRG